MIGIAALDKYHDLTEQYNDYTTNINLPVLVNYNTSLIGNILKFISINLSICNQLSGLECLLKYRRLATIGNDDPLNFITMIISGLHGISFGVLIDDYVCITTSFTGIN